MRRGVGSHRGELAAFDEPRFHDISDGGGAPSTVSPREHLRGFALVGRAVVAVLVVGLAPTVGDDGRATDLGWLVALVWLPGVGLLDLIERRLGSSRLTTACLLLWDVALFAAVDATLDEPGVAAVGYVLTTAFHAYVGGTRLGVVALGLCTVAAIVAPVLGDQDVPALRVAVEVAALALVAALLGDASARHDTSRAGLARAERKASAVLGRIADAVVVTDRAGRVREANPAAVATVGSPRDEMVGRRCGDVLGLHSGLRPLVCDAGCALLGDQESVTSVEVWREDATGRRQPLLASAAAVTEADGTAVEVVHSFRDITSLKAADEAKTLFLATASHELKTPLTVIRGFAELLHRTDAMTPEQYAGAVDAIQGRAEELAGIVDRLLMSSRIDAGRIDLGGTLIDLVPIITTRTQAFGAAHNLTVATDVADSLPPVYGDHDGILTILDHLLDNALKYSPQQAQISVSAHPRADGNVALAVTDRGIGMTALQAQHCFDRFWQAESSDARRFGGTGIGLYIVKSLVDAMGGTISVNTAPGHGSRFEITLSTTPPQHHSDDRAEAEGGQSSMIREYMRQVGVPLTGGRA